MIVTDVEIAVGTQTPTGSAIIVDVKTWDGAGLTSMFTGGNRPSIAIAAAAGGASPDGTYARRCLSSLAGAFLSAAGSVLSFDIAQVGSTLPGAGMAVQIRALQFLRPLEIFLGAGDVG